MRKTNYKATKVNGVKRDYHRALMEEHVGRTLDYDEMVHHVNENKLDNDIDNLRVMSRADHSRLHQLGRKMPEEGVRKRALNRRGKLYGTPRKLTDEQVSYIKDNYIPRDKEFGTRALARKFGISHSEISRLLRGKTYTSTEQYFTGP